MSFPIYISDKATACPHLRFVFGISEKGEKIRIGPKLSVMDMIKMGEKSIRVTQYILRRSEGRVEIDCDYPIDLEHADPSQSFHDYFYSILSELSKKV